MANNGFCIRVTKSEEQKMAEAWERGYGHLALLRKKFWLYTVTTNLCISVQFCCSFLLLPLPTTGPCLTAGWLFQATTCHTTLAWPALCQTTPPWRSSSMVGTHCLSYHRTTTATCRRDGGVVGTPGMEGWWRGRCRLSVVYLHLPPPPPPILLIVTKLHTQSLLAKS